MKKFLIIPILIFVYIFFINFLPQISFQSIGFLETPKSGIGEVVNIGQSIGVSVIRPYFFGLIYLPVYIEGLGDIGFYNDVFFSLIFILTAIFILIEIKNRKEVKAKKTKIKRR